MHRRKSKFPSKQSPGEREKDATLSHPVTRGGVGERSAPRPLRRKPNSSPECLHRQKSKSPPAQPHGRAREGRNPLAPRRPRGCRGAERPTPRSVGNQTPTRTDAPAPSKNEIPSGIASRAIRNPTSRQSSPGRAREGVNPLDFQSRPATCAAERLLAQRASKSLRDRPSEIEDFGWSPPGADFFGAGACPRRKNRFLADSAPGNPQDFSGI